MEQKSVFVTVLAWLFIVFSSLGLLMFAMEAAIVWTLPFDKLMEQGATLAHNQPQVSTAHLGGFLRWGVVVILLFQAWVLVSSIGLLLRKNWARISFIVFLVISLVWNGLNLLFAILGMVDMHVIGNTATLPGLPPGFQGFLQAFMIVFVIFDLVLLVLFGWILKKLVSEDIRKEFVKPADKPGALAA